VIIEYSCNKTEFNIYLRDYTNKAIPFVYAGAGLNYYVNPNVFLTFQVKVDMLRDSQSPYGNAWHPIYNVGVGFGM
jgi:hypothetical protein